MGVVVKRDAIFLVGLDAEGECVHAGELKAAGGDGGLGFDPGFWR